MILKDLLDHFNDRPELRARIKELATAEEGGYIDEFTPECIYPDSKGIRRIMSTAFTFHDTEEGAQYWNDIYNSLPS